MRTGVALASSRLLVAVAASTGLLVSGCNGGSPASDSSPDTPSSSPSPSDSSPAASLTPTAGTPPARPAAGRGVAGQRAFAQHVMDLWGYALRTNDTRPLLALRPGKKACDGCQEFARELAGRKKQGWSVDFPGVDVRAIRVVRARDSVLARATVDLPESDSFNDDGSYRNTSPAHTGARFDVRMRLTKAGYTLLSFTVT